MDLYNKVFQEALDQNVTTSDRWETYKNSLIQTQENLCTFIKSHKHEIMVPIGKKAFIPGTLQHTNDILVSHNSNYFSLMSKHEAEEILKLRSKICDDHLEGLEKEKELFSGKLNVQGDVFAEKEIIEDYDEQQEMEWRKKHQENIKKHKQIEAKERDHKDKNEDIEQLFDRYELLEEMAEELENLEIEESDDILQKLMTSEIVNIGSKNRVAHSAVTEKSLQVVPEKSIPGKSEEQSLETSDNSNSEKKKKKRKVRFSSSLEDVKIIDSRHEEVLQEPRTIFIEFHHSSAKFQPAEENNQEENDSIIIAHPGEVYKVFNSPKSLKSILKDTKYEYTNDKPEVNVEISKSQPFNEYANEDVENYPYVMNSIIGDVIERKNIDDNVIEEKATAKKGARNMSKFRQMRSK